MRRREFLGLVGGLVALESHAGLAQQQQRTRHVALLMSGRGAEAQTRIEASFLPNADELIE
jgi:hypothetical protein